MDKKKIDRINELGRKSRTPGGLSEEEKTEQAKLRAEYLQWFRASIRGSSEKGSEGK